MANDFIFLTGSCCIALRNHDEWKILKKTKKNMNRKDIVLLVDNNKLATR